MWSSFVVKFLTAMDPQVVSGQCHTAASVGETMPVSYFRTACSGIPKRLLPIRNALSSPMWIAARTVFEQQFHRVAT